MLWKAGGAVAAVLVLAFLISYLGFQKSDSGIAGPVLQPRHEVATIDLRNASIARSVEPSGPLTKGPTIELSSAILSLTIQLPIGSEPGAYEVAIRKPNEPVSLVVVKGMADLDGGITKLTVDLDTSTIPTGSYDFAWRMADFDWRSYPVQIR
jgi:hypothetical protein